MSRDDLLPGRSRLAAISVWFTCSCNKHIPTNTSVHHTLIFQAVHAKRPQSSVRSIMSSGLGTLRLPDSPVKVTSPSSPSSVSSCCSLPTVTERWRLRLRPSCLTSDLMLLIASCLARRSRFCSRNSSGVRVSGSRSSSGTGDGLRSMMPSTCRSSDNGQYHVNILEDAPYILCERYLKT